MCRKVIVLFTVLLVVSCNNNPTSKVAESAYGQEETTESPEGLGLKKTILRILDNPDEVFPTDYEGLVGSLGGISDLSGTVENTTNYTIDEITVKVEYILANGNLFKQEELTFNNIGSGEGWQSTAPDSKRGKTIQVSVSAVKCKELGIDIIENGREQVFS